MLKTITWREAVNDLCIHTYCKWEFLVPCRSSTACRFPDDVLHEASICFSSLPLAEWEGLLGMPTSTNVSEPKGNKHRCFFLISLFIPFWLLGPQRLNKRRDKRDSVSGDGMVRSLGVFNCDKSQLNPGLIKISSCNYNVVFSRCSTFTLTGSCSV